MKKLLLLTLVLILISPFSFAVSQGNQVKVTEILDGAGFNSVWSQDISLWIENPGGFTEMDLEKIGYTICDSTPGIGFYVITFWQSIRGPSGKITNVTCR